MRGGSCKLNKKFQGSCEICYSERGQPFVSVRLLYEVFLLWRVSVTLRWKRKAGKQTNVCMQRTLSIHLDSIWFFLNFLWLFSPFSSLLREMNVTHYMTQLLYNDLTNVSNFLLDRAFERLTCQPWCHVSWHEGKLPA